MSLPRLFVVLILLLCIAGVPKTGSAEEVSHFAVVDIDALLNDSAAGKSIQKQLKEKREEFQKEFAKKESELRESEKNIIDKKGKISAEELAKERKKFETGLLETKKLFQKRRRELDRGLATAMQELRKQIVQAAAEIAEEKKYQAIFSRESVVVVEKEFDITKDVLEKLNKKTKSIPLKMK